MPGHPRVGFVGRRARFHLQLSVRDLGKGKASIPALMPAEAETGASVKIGNSWAENPGVSVISSI